MVLLVKDDNIHIERLTLGPWGTNAYIVICPRTHESVLIDAPAGAGNIVESLRGTNPRYILLTHNHMDHIGALSELHSRLKVPLASHASDAGNLPSQPDIFLNDGYTVSFGTINLEILHTPGHTPGSVCFKWNKYLISGDTIFPGGPGKSWSPGAFKEIVNSITQKIFTLPDDTRIYPGHGDTTELKKEKDEFAIFSSRSHDSDLCGDVLWLKS